MAETAEQVPDAPAAEPREDAASGVPTVVSEGAEDTFTAKVREGGDFAIAQVKNAQRELSRMKSEMGPVEQVVKALGGHDAPLLTQLRRLNAIVSNPAMRQVVERFEQTGMPQIPSSKAEPEGEDEYEEPWDKSIAPVSREVNALRSELGKLRGERGVEKVQGFFRQFREEFNLPDEEWGTFTETMSQQANQWKTNPQGIQLLDGMDYQTFRALGLGKIPKEHLRAAFDREAEVKRASKAASATDGPTRVGTTGREKPVNMTPLEAFIEGCRREGISPDSFHRLIK